jgi:hypothetical protein
LCGKIGKIFLLYNKPSDEQLARIEKFEEKLERYEGLTKAQMVMAVSESMALL